MYKDLKNLPNLYIVVVEYSVHCLNHIVKFDEEIRRKNVDMSSLIKLKTLTLNVLGFH